MKIEIEIPEWAGERTIMIFAGQEPIAYKHYGKPLKVKTVRCNRCGECCLTVPDDKLFCGTNGEGKCNDLRADGLCGSGVWKPFCCCVPIEKPEDYCCIRYK